jgi:hypothetical protein
VSAIHAVVRSVASTWHNGNGDGYLFISGIAGLATYVAVLGVAWQVYRRHLCNVKHCWRIAWRAHGEHVLCKKHHPAAEPVAEDFLPGGKHHDLPERAAPGAGEPSHSA